MENKIRVNTRDAEKIQDFGTIAEAAEYMGILEYDLRWALEEIGRCDTAEHTAWIPEQDDEQFPFIEAE